MAKNIFNPIDCCDDRLVTDFVDKRMTKKEAELYIQKIENCIKTKNCTKCKKLLDDFTLLKQSCTAIKKPLLMPNSVENKLLKRLHEALIQAKAR